MPLVWQTITQPTLLSHNDEPKQATNEAYRIVPHLSDSIAEATFIGPEYGTASLDNRRRGTPHITGTQAYRNTNTQ
jgi:hypothetical protein